MILNMIAYLLFAVQTWYVCLELRTEEMVFNNLMIKDD